MEAFPTTLVLVLALSVQTTRASLSGPPSRLVVNGNTKVIAPFVDIRNSSSRENLNRPILVCYYTPTGYFPASRVPADACTHIIYAFGQISSSSPTIVDPTQGQKSAWATLTSLRQKNPSLKVMLSLQQGFPNVVGADASKMKSFAMNSVAYLRKYGLDGIDMDWEFPSSSDRDNFASFFMLMRTAINQDAKATGNAPLLLSLALPNNQFVAAKSYDIPTISSAVDFGTAMTYDFHVYNSKDTNTGYNSPLFTPPGDSKYLSSAAMAQYYLSQGMTSGKLLLGIPTYGRSWKLQSASNHGLRAPAVGKGDPGPYRHLTGVYTYPDSCTALKQGATKVYNSTLGAVYLYQDITWVAYDDVNTVTLKSQWALKSGLGGFGVWAMHIDDIDGVCGAGPLPLIATLRNSLAAAAGDRQLQTSNVNDDTNKSSDEGSTSLRFRVRRDGKSKAEKPRVHNGN